MSFTIMTPQHSVERAYVEWVIKAVEVILQSRMKPGMIPNLMVRPSRQFALIFPETRDVRSKILNDPTSFFRDRSRITLELLVNETVAERWVFSFDSPMDMIPTARSERRDVSLPRRLTVSLRSLLSLTCLMAPLLGDENGDITFVIHEGKNDLITSPRTPGSLTPMDFCCIPSSFGNLSLGVFSRDRWGSPHVSPKLTSATATSPVSLPVSTPPHSLILLDETFIQTHSLGGIEMVIEVDEKHSFEKSFPRVSSVASISKSPLRDLTEIWPTSNLSYSSSPRDRAPSFASSSGDEEAVGPYISAIPGWPQTKAPNEHSLFPEADRLHSMYEKPVPVSSIIGFIDQFQNKVNR